VTTSYKGVRGGTVFGEPLCTTCRLAGRVTGQSLTQDRMFCHSLGKELTFLAYECSVYDDKRNPSKWDMEQIAWVLVTDVKTKRIGFRAPDRNGKPPDD
jgi:signal recognition particle subunit SEC65